MAVDFFLLGQSNDHGEGNQPFPGNAFVVDGREPLFARFSKVTGLREEIETVAWRDGRNPLLVRKGIGTLSGGTATFEKGILLRPRALLRWFSAVRRCAIALEAATAIGVSRTTERSPTNVFVIDAIRAILFHGGSGRDGKGGGRLRQEIDSEAAANALPMVGDFNELPELYHTVEIKIGSKEVTSQDSETRSFFAASQVRSVRLEKCFPVAYQIADLDAMASEVAIESLTVSFDALIPDSDVVGLLG